MDAVDKKPTLHKSFARIKRLFIYLGVEGMKEEKTAAIFVKKYWWALLQCVLCQPIIAAEIFMFYRSLVITNELKIVVTSSSCMMTCLLGTIKVMSMISHPGQMDDLNRELVKLWPEEPHSDRIKAIIDKPLASLATICNMLIYVYIIIVSTFHVVPFIAMPYYYFTGEKVPLMLPWPTWYPFGIQENIYVYLVLYVHHILCGNFVAVAIGACDSYLSFCITHISIQFEILFSDLLNIVEVHHHKYTAEENTNVLDGTISNETPYDKDDYEIPHQDELYQSLNAIIKRHNTLIILVKKLDAIFSLTILINFVVSSFLVCMVGFQVCNSVSQSGEVNKLLIFQFALGLPAKVLQIGMLCWNGDKIMCASVKIADAAYSCKWYFTNSQFKTSLIYIIRRSQLPISITAYSFSIVSLQSFTSVMSKAWSYFTLLRTSVEN